MALDWIGASMFSTMGTHGIGMESLLTLGRQRFAVNRHDMQHDPRIAGIVDKLPIPPAGEVGFAEPFFHALGVQTVDSLDASDYESCSRVHDLNSPIPTAWHGQYDVVFDGGTLEHVFHFPNAIANAMNLVKQGGVMVSIAPSNNFNGHGFYQFSPELFFRVFCEANGYRILLMALVESKGNKKLFRVQDPDRIGRRITFGSGSNLQMVMVARRERIVPLFGEPPLQSDYTAIWNDSRANNGASAGPVVRTGLIRSLKKQARRILPASWTYRYDRMLIDKKHRRAELDGVTQVKSIHDCWLSQPETSNHICRANPQTSTTFSKTLGMNEKQALQEAEYEVPIHWGLVRAEGLKYRCLSNRLGALVAAIPEVAAAKRVTFLDLGCGDGASTTQVVQAIRKRGIDVFAHGYDYSERAIALAVEKTSAMDNPPSFSVQPVETMTTVPTQNGPVVVLMREVLEHLTNEQIDAAFSKLKKLYPGFHLIATTPSDNSPVEPKHYRHYSKEILTSTLARNDMSPIRVMGFSFRPRALFAPLSRFKSGLNRRPFFWRLTRPLWAMYPPQWSQTLVALTKDSANKQ
jgi:2-polyprenyl-3-methyl-5-hydroxy-6-metoxy-1,4-benzoquinol methylase